MSNKVVLDTSVVVAALIGEAGPAREVLRWVLQGRVAPQIGNALANEYREVCWREDVTAKLPITPEERDELMAAFLACCRWVEIYYLWRPNLRDEADNHLIELALAAGASVVVTNNLRDVGYGELDFPGLRVLRPEQFLALAEAEQWVR